MDILLYFLTVIKILLVPLLIILSVTGNPTGFMIFFIIIILIGLLDDIIARKFKLFSLTKAMIGSWTDFVTIPISICCAWILWPMLFRQGAIFWVILVVSFYVPVIVGLVKYSRLTIYHTWPTRIAALLVGISVVLFFLGSLKWPIEVAICLYLCARMEEIAITAILPEWKFNVPTLWHAISIERGREKAAKVKAEEKLRIVLANISECYLEADLKGNLTFFNQTLCRYLGYTEHELLGMNNRQIMSEEMSGKIFSVFNEIYRTGKPLFATDLEILTKQGAIIHFETSVSLLRDSAGAPAGFRGIGRDITERKHAEEAARIHQEKLRHASKMVTLGALVSGVAHEINNPNNFIMLNTPVLREAWKGMQPILDEYFRENGEFSLAGMDYSMMRNRIPLLLSGIGAGSNSILKIVQDLKKYVRNDAPGLDHDVDLNAVVASALSLITNMIQTSTKHFSVVYGKDLPCIKGNVQRLEQIVINLVQNACQALQNNEKAITLTTGIDNGHRHIRLTVRDEGVGISKENMARITDQFFTTRQNVGGLGMGLSISRRIIEEHGGDMTIESEEGKGTRVEVILPVC